AAGPGRAAGLPGEPEELELELRSWREVPPKEPTADGLTSTSLLELAVMSHLEALNSQEQPSPEAPEGELGPGTLHAAPGSGFASEENEESKILQPPQYFWEDGGELNDSSLDLGPATASQEESLFSDLFSTSSVRAAVVTEAAVGIQDEDTAPLGSDLGSSMGPGVLPMSSVFSATSAARSPGVSEEPFEVTTGDMWAVEGADLEPTVTTSRTELTEPSVEPGGEEHLSREEFPETTVGWEMLEPTELPETEQTLETPVGTPSPSSSSLDTQTFSGGDQYPSFSTATWVTSEEPALDLAWNDTELATEMVAGERSLSPQPGDARMAVLPTEMPWNSPQVACERTVISFGKHLLGMQAPSLFPSLACAVLSAGELHSLPKLSCLYALSFQVICKDWSNLAGKNYIILNMSDNIDCEEFRLERGPQLLALVEDAFSRQMDGLQERWLISLSKPNENDKHLLMTLAGEQGVIPTKDVLMALGDVKRSLAEIGIQNYSTTTSCQSHPNQPRSDYGKLFVVLVIIGSICAIIIVMGLIYNCWQRRLPKMKNMSHGEELRFVENGCHDNPTLDVASDSQSEMQEKKPSVNGGNTINGPDSWDVLINKQASEEVDVFEEDTHL
uniref:Podocalyxin like 2 n=1 Tax=Nothoprocta perdicaria TaxID=30464 RepID=A0A8C7EBC1_NOTPE